MYNIFGLSSFQRKLHINLTTNPSVININVANCHVLLSFEMAVGLTLSSFFFEESTILQSRLETCKPRSVSAFSQMYCRAIQVYGARVKIKTMRRWKVLNLDFRSPITHWITYISPYPSVSDDDYFFWRKPYPWFVPLVPGSSADVIMLSVNYQDWSDHRLFCSCHNGAGASGLCLSIVISIVRWKRWVLEATKNCCLPSRRPTLLASPDFDLFFVVRDDCVAFLPDGPSDEDLCESVGTGAGDVGLAGVKSDVEDALVKFLAMRRDLLHAGLCLQVP